MYLNENPKFINRYFFFLALMIPISSVLVIPSVQGTTPGFIVSLFGLILAFVFLKSKDIKSQILKDLIVFFYVFTLLTSISQLCNSLLRIPDISNLRLVEYSEPWKTVFRSSLITQSIYLIPGVLTLVFVKRFYTPYWDKFLVISIMLFVSYGFFEFIYFIIFHDFGDFISNRNFGEQETMKLGNQLMTIGSFVFQRINSLAPEPSMYAFTVLPFWVYFKHIGKKWLSRFLLLGLIFSASTTAFIGIACYYILYGIFKSSKLQLFFMICTGILIVLLFNDIVSAFVDKTFLQKIQLSTESGIDRNHYFKTHIEYFFNLNFLSMLFGIGFGVVRSTDFFSTLLVNTGIIGVIIFTSSFFYPIFRLKNTYRNIGIKFALFIIYLSMMMSVPEFSYLHIWLFLGIAYNEINRQRLKTLS